MRWLSIVQRCMKPSELSMTSIGQRISALLLLCQEGAVGAEAGAVRGEFLPSSSLFLSVFCPGGVPGASGLFDPTHGLLFGAEIGNLIDKGRRENWVRVIWPHSGSFGRELPTSSTRFAVLLDVLSVTYANSAPVRGRLPRSPCCWESF